MPFGRTTWAGISSGLEAMVAKLRQGSTPDPAFLHRGPTPVGARYLAHSATWKVYMCPSKEKAQVMAGRAISAGRDANIHPGPQGKYVCEVSRTKGSAWPTR